MMTACVAIYKIAKAWGHHARLTVLGLFATRNPQPAARSPVQRARRTRSSSSRIKHTAPTVMAASATLNAGKCQAA